LVRIPLPPALPLVLRRRLPIGGILLAAAAVRLWGIGFGLPHTLTRPDEDAIVSVAERFFTRDLNPHFFNYPTLFMYVLGLGYVLYFKAGRTLGWFGSEYRFLRFATANQGPFFLMARLLSAAAGVATVGVVYRTATRLFSRRAALVAALFLALSFLHVRDSHFGVTDVAATLLISVSFLFLVRLSESGRRRDLVAAALAAGLATSTKYNAALIVLPAVWVILGPIGRQKRAWPERLIGMAAYAAVAAMAFVATSPFVLLDFPTFLTALRFETEHLRSGHGVNLGRGWGAHLDLSLGYGFGTWRLALGVAGFAELIRRNWKTGVMLALFPAAYYLALGAGYTVFVRYMVPVVPFLCLSGAFLLDEVATGIARRTRRPAWGHLILWALVAVFLGPSTMRIVRFNNLLNQDDSRVLAAQWIRQTFPDGATIGQHGPAYGRLQFPLEEDGSEGKYRSLTFDRERMAFRSGRRDVDESPDVIVIQRAPVDLYDDAPHRLMRVVQADFSLAHTIVAFERPAAGHSRTYDWQDAFYVPLQGFDGVHRPGPNLTIYVRRSLIPGTKAAGPPLR
jgi:4-amino-4-deoxy-L-arabinose transferase-like glycosyltransferase